MPRAKKRKKDDDEPKTKARIGGVMDDIVYETIYDGTTYQYAIGHRQKDGEVKVSTVWHLEDWDSLEDCDVMVVPWRSDLIEKGTVITPTKYKKYKSKRQLYDDTLQYFKNYVDLPEVENKLNTHYVAMSWLYDRLAELPYRRFLGDFGTGKSRALTAMAMICYRPFIYKAVATPATIFRMIEQVRGTLCIDEMNLQGEIRGEANRALESVLCAGYERNSSVVRCVAQEGDEKGFRLEAFQTFSPKILSTRTSFNDRALESRCLTAHTYRTKNPKIPVSLTKEFYAEAEELRNQWLVFRLVNYWKPLIEPSSVRELYHIEARIRQIVSPLAQTAFRQDRDFFVDYAKVQHEEFVMLRRETREGQLLSAMLDIGGLEPHDIKTQSLIATLHESDDTWNAKTVGRTLRSLGLKSYRKVEADGRFRYGRNTKKYHGVFLRKLEDYYLLEGNELDEESKRSLLAQKVLPSITQVLPDEGPDGPHLPDGPHPDRDTPTVTIYPCPHCDFRGNSEEDLGKHLQDKHNYDVGVLTDE